MCLKDRILSSQQHNQDAVVLKRNESYSLQIVDKRRYKKDDYADP